MKEHEAKISQYIPNSKYKYCFSRVCVCAKSWSLKEMHFSLKTKYFKRIVTQCISSNLKWTDKTKITHQLYYKGVLEFYFTLTERALLNLYFYHKS
jgi:hypothetical protein